MTTKVIDRPPTRVDGVAIGTVMDVHPDGSLSIHCPAVAGDSPLTARATVPIARDDIGAEVAVMFVGGAVDQPLVMGLILDGSQAEETAEIPVLTQAGATRTQVQIDDGEPQDFQLIEGREMVVLKCGRASITLTKEGKVLIRGAYISSRSSGVNRIKGGSVHLN